MSDGSTRIVVKPQEENASEFEMSAIVFRGRVCVSFKCVESQKQLAEKLSGMLHDSADLSIAVKGDVHTMNTRFAGIPDMMDFLRRFGFSCREAPGQFPSGVRQIRVTGEPR